MREDPIISEHVIRERLHLDGEHGRLLLIEDVPDVQHLGQGGRTGPTPSCLAVKKTEGLVGDQHPSVRFSVYELVGEVRRVVVGMGTANGQG